jgi:hypothetical protein
MGCPPRGTAPWTFSRIPNSGARPGPRDWRSPRSPGEACRLVVSVEQERLATAIRGRLDAEGRSVPQLAEAIGVGFRQLLAKLKGEIPLRADEFVIWQWLLGEHRGIRIPKPEAALPNFTSSHRAQLTG